MSRFYVFGTQNLADGVILHFAALTAGSSDCCQRLTQVPMSVFQFFLYHHGSRWVFDYKQYNFEHFDQLRNIFCKCQDKEGILAVVIVRFCARSAPKFFADRGQLEVHGLHGGLQQAFYSRMV